MKSIFGRIAERVPAVDLCDLILQATEIKTGRFLDRWLCLGHTWPCARGIFDRLPQVVPIAEKKGKLKDKPRTNMEA